MTRDAYNDTENKRYHATLDPGRNIVYGRITMAGGGVSNSLFTLASGAVAYIYGPTRVVDNNELTGIEITTPEPLIVAVGETATLDYTLTPADSFGRRLNWISLNKNIATVDNSGTVTGKAAGSTQIVVAAAENPDVSDSIGLIAVSPVINGADQLVGSGSETYTLDLGVSDRGSASVGICRIACWPILTAQPAL